jgi:hypothetical protein
MDIMKVRGRIRARRFLLLLMVLLLVRTSADAYGRTWMGANLEYAVRQAVLKIGPFRLRTILVLSNAGYDSNVYRTATNPVKDYSITAGPAFYLYLPIRKKIVFSIYESPQYVYFLETKRERTWNQYTSAQASIALERLFLSAGAGYSKAREIWNTEIDIRPQRTENSLKGDALWQVSRKTSLQLGYRESKFDYEDLSLGAANIKQTLNHTERYLSGSLYLQLTGKIRGGAEYEQGRFDFQSPGSPRNSESQAVYGKINLAPVGRISGSVRIGVKDFRLRSGPGGNFRGVAGDSDISIKLGQSMKLRGTYGRDVQFSTWFGYAYFIENRAGAGISVYPFRKIRLDYDYFTGDNYYPLASLTGEGQDAERTDRNRTHRVGIYLRLKGRMAFGLSINWWQRDSTLVWFSGKRTFFGANLIYDF